MCSIGLVRGCARYHTREPRGVETGISGTAHALAIHPLPKSSLSASRLHPPRAMGSGVNKERQELVDALALLLQLREVAQNSAFVPSVNETLRRHGALTEQKLRDYLASLGPES
jgi:hypothetical protein